MNGTRLFSMLLLTILLAACGLSAPNPADTPLAAFPGFLTTTALDTAELLHQEPVADGRILLYRYQGEQNSCLATVFEAQFPNGSRQPQSASQLNCPQSETFPAAYSKSGRFSTAYGLAPGGRQVLVQWSDGRSSLVAVEDGVFIQSRPGRLHVTRFELLDANGNLLAHHDNPLAATTIENGPLAGR